MINNIDLIIPFFNFNEANNMFMHCQIVQRAKDHKEEKVKEGAIKTYFIRSREHLKRLMPEIILLCEHYGARAYINVAGKDFDQLQKLMLQKLATDVCHGIIRNPRRILNSAAGELKSRYIAWIVDVDDHEKKEDIYNWLKTAIEKRWNPVYCIREIPTVQCCHFITLFKFDTQEFNHVFPDVDIHKNSMGTLLYYPNSLENG